MVIFRREGSGSNYLDVEREESCVLDGGRPSAGNHHLREQMK